MTTIEFANKIQDKMLETGWKPDENDPYMYDKYPLIIRYRRKFLGSDTYEFELFFPRGELFKEKLVINIRQSQEDKVSGFLTYESLITKNLGDFKYFFSNHVENHFYRDKYIEEFPEGLYTNRTLLYLMEDLLKISISK